MNSTCIQIWDLFRFWTIESQRISKETVSSYSATSATNENVGRHAIEWTFEALQFLPFKKCTSIIAVRCKRSMLFSMTGVFLITVQIAVTLVNSNSLSSTLYLQPNSRRIQLWAKDGINDRLM